VSTGIGGVPSRPTALSDGNTFFLFSCIQHRFDRNLLSTSNYPLTADVRTFAHAERNIVYIVTCLTEVKKFQSSFLSSADSSVLQVGATFQLLLTMKGCCDTNESPAKRKEVHLFIARLYTEYNIPETNLYRYDKSLW